MNVLQTQTDLNLGSTANNSGVGPSVTLTIRLIMQGKEVGSIIGKKGDNIKRFREESGAKITISEATCPERIVTVTGSTDAIIKAFTLISRKFEDVNRRSSSKPYDFDLDWSMQDATGSSGSSSLSLSSSGTNSSVAGATSNGKAAPMPPVSLKLIVPASQCGSLIGKGGSKIKEIRESTGVSIQVASEMLPSSTERAVTLSGTAESITRCIHQICCVLLESPPKGPTIPYRPKPAMPPVFFAGGQAFTIQGQFAIPHPDAFSVTGASLPSPSPFFETAQSCALQHQAAAAYLSQHFSQPQQVQLASSCVHHQSVPQSSSPQHLIAEHGTPPPAVPVTSAASAELTPQAHQSAPPPPATQPQQNGTLPAPPTAFLDHLTPAAIAQFVQGAGFLTKLHRLALQHAPLLPGHAVGSLSPQATLATLANSATSLGHATTAASNAGVVPTLTTEMKIPNDIIGSVIGKQGAKINEIRQLSGATIKINNNEDGSKERTVLISGSPEAINLAQYLITTRHPYLKSLYHYIIARYEAAQQERYAIEQLNASTGSPNSSSSSSSVGGGSSSQSYSQSEQQQFYQQQQQQHYHLMMQQYLQYYHSHQTNYYNESIAHSVAYGTSGEEYPVDTPSQSSSESDAFQGSQCHSSEACLAATHQSHHQPTESVMSYHVPNGYMPQYGLEQSPHHYLNSSSVSSATTPPPHVPTYGYGTTMVHY